MALTIAVQMDPIEKINIQGDSTFALMLEAQARGHTLFYYTPDKLSFRMGRILARGWPVTVRRVVGDHFTLGEEAEIDLAEVSHRRVARHGLQPLPGGREAVARRGAGGAGHVGLHGGEQAPHLLEALVGDGPLRRPVERHGEDAAGHGDLQGVDVRLRPHAHVTSGA